jgi:FKBP-type peptidyl-prolyl cis-trans isomerase SlyD
MKIEKDLMVSLVYELREGTTEGTVIEKLDESRPLSFIFGSGKLLPAFESNIENLSQGDKFAFTLNAGDAYGERREDMIIDIPSSVFMHDGKIDENICSVGNSVPMMDSSGNRLDGVILEINSDSVKMDFNHPMAGADLCFSGTVHEVRIPTPDELHPSHGSCSSCGSHGNSGGCSGC